MPILNFFFHELCIVAVNHNIHVRSLSGIEIIDQTAITHVLTSIITNGYDSGLFFIRTFQTGVNLWPVIEN